MGKESLKWWAEHSPQAAAAAAAAKDAEAEAAKDAEVKAKPPRHESGGRMFGAEELEGTGGLPDAPSTLEDELGRELDKQAIEDARRRVGEASDVPTVVGQPETPPRGVKIVMGTPEENSPRVDA